MELLSTLTKSRADRLYQPLDDIFRRDLNDNDIEVIVIGDASTVRKVVVSYSFELPISNRSQSGELTITQDSSGVDLSHEYSFLDPEIDSVVFDVDVTGGDIRLLIACTNIGENPVFQYRRASIPIA
jgi:hypothetical protein